MSGGGGSATIVLAARGLGKRFFPRRRALEDVSFEVRTGCIHGVIGLNGAGKSTLLRIILGIARPSTGMCTVMGIAPRRARHVAAALEQPALLGHLSGEQNVAFLAAISGGPGVEDPVAIVDALGLGSAARRPVRTYSKGMRRLTAIGAALAVRPALLVLDEPTDGLDPGAVARVLDVLEDRRRAGGTTIMSSHRLGDIGKVCDDLLVLHEGTVRYRGPTGGLLREGVMVRTERQREAMDVLGSRGFRTEARSGGIAVLDAEPAAVNQALAEAGIFVSALERLDGDLEDALTRELLRDDA